MLLQKLLYRLRGRIHLALHIAGPGPGPVVEDPLIMNEAVGIKGAEPVRHISDHSSSKGLVAHGPDQDRGMVLVSLIAGIDAVQQKLAPPLIIPGDNAGSRQSRFSGRPAGVGLHVVFRDQIQAQFITEAVEGRGIRIMTGADSVDIVLLHQNEIPAGDLCRDSPAAVAGKFVPVHAAENDPLPVQAHQPVLHLKSAETDPLADDLQKDLLKSRPVTGIPAGSRSLTDQTQGQVIKLRVLGAPQGRFFNLFNKGKGEPGASSLCICVLTHMPRQLIRIRQVRQRHSSAQHHTAF